MQQMAWKGEFAIVLGVLVCATVTVTEPRKFLKVEQFLNKRIFYSEKITSFGDVFLYSSCDFDISNKTDLNCELIQQTVNFNGTDHKLRCPLKLVDVRGKHMQLYHVEKGKAVIIYDDSKRSIMRRILRLVNVDMRSCKTTKTYIETTPKDSDGNCNWNFWLPGLDVLPHIDSRGDIKYDVIIRYRLPKKICKGTYDFKGNVIRELSGWEQVSFKNRTTPRIVNTNNYSPADGYLTFSEGKDKVEADLIQDGDTKILKSWDPKAEIDVYATNDGAIRFCMLVNQTVECSMFNLEGNVKQVTYLENVLEDRYAMYNLADGFLILSHACFDSNFNFLKQPMMFCKKQKFFIRRYNSQGKLVKEVTADDFVTNQFEYIYFGKIFRNEIGEYCASLAMYLLKYEDPKLNVPQYVEFTAQCFSDL